ncbi:MAG: DegT/DnrJ/EryC1/StrS aminotransferase family protein [candidate division Zixibacteria bacterium]|nr:DegT/DnrJ/EryC1/StrS aminotransferase family protein [candidate division Zixibacteria bacterium]
MSKIPITRPVFGGEEQLAIEEVLKSGWVVQGPKVQRFENMVAKFVGCRHAIATTSCTAALHLSLLAAGVSPGDEVLLPSFTFIATANAVEYTGAKPVFIDIDLKTFNIDPVKIREYLESLPRNNPTWPKVLLPVALFGLCADMAALNALAREFGLVVIEDAACALGAVRDGHPAGTEGLAGNLSFHPRKAVTTGEGGMVTTNDDTLAAEIRQLRDHGAAKTDLERHLRQGGSLLPEYFHLGYNYRMTDIQGAIGTAQMNRVEDILRGRHEVAERYNRLLVDIPELTIPYVPDKYYHAYQSYVCLFRTDPAWFEDGSEILPEILANKNRERNRLMAALEENGIAVRQGTHAVHTLAYYRQKYGLDDFDYPRSFIADRLSITLPLYYGMTDDEQIRVVTVINKILAD